MMAVHRARGTRDYLPEVMHERRYVFNLLATLFEEHGFEPLDTPAFERIETLVGQYGEEGDKLIFKIQKRGRGAETGQCDLALRYDLTVPLARIVAMNPGLRMPFKRFHMGPAWRADRPARGRFREFWQCDGDIIGTTSVTAEAECLSFASRALSTLGFPGVLFKLNDRRILRGLASHLNVSSREQELLITIDKLDKIGKDGVNKELLQRGFSEDVVTELWLTLDGPDDALERVERRLGHEEGVTEAIKDLREITRRAQALGCPPACLAIDPTIARGLDYYTGPVWEGVLPGENMGTVCSGGRYDELIGSLGGRPQPAVGVSIGVERLLVLREERGLQHTVRTAAPVLVGIYDSEHQDLSFALTRLLREEGIGADLYPDARKLKAQFKYANGRGYRWIALRGPDESKNNTVTIKELETGKQTTLPLDTTVDYLHTRLSG